jgi:hypothetical protein
LDVYLFELAFQPQLIIEDLSGKNLISCGRRREMKRIKKENYVHQGFTSPRLNMKSPGRYQELDLFIKVLRLLCPNLTDASLSSLTP